MTPPLSHPLDRRHLPPETGRPAPDRVLAGDPVHTTWPTAAPQGMYCGVWQSTPGRWRVIYTEWEYFHILSGHSVLTGDDGAEWVLTPGTSHVIHPGFAGTWTVIETTVKDYVIRE